MSKKNQETQQALHWRKRREQANRAQISGGYALTAGRMVARQQKTRAIN